MVAFGPAKYLNRAANGGTTNSPDEVWWRREGDSNPQGLVGRTGFRDRLLSQFGHPSSKLRLTFIFASQSLAKANSSGEAWYARLDLNQRPSAPEADALIH